MMWTPSHITRFVFTFLVSCGMRKKSNRKFDDRMECILSDNSLSLSNLENNIKNENIIASAIEYSFSLRCGCHINRKTISKEFRLSRETYVCSPISNLPPATVLFLVLFFFILLKLFRECVRRDFDVTFLIFAASSLGRKRFLLSGKSRR